MGFGYVQRGHGFQRLRPRVYVNDSLSSGVSEMQTQRLCISLLALVAPRRLVHVTNDCVLACELCTGSQRGGNRLRKSCDLRRSQPRREVVRAYPFAFRVFLACDCP